MDYFSHKISFRTYVANFDGRFVNPYIEGLAGCEGRRHNALDGGAGHFLAVRPDDHVSRRPGPGNRGGFLDPVFARGKLFVTAVALDAQVPDSTPQIEAPQISPWGAAPWMT